MVVKKELALPAPAVKVLEKVKAIFERAKALPKKIRLAAAGGLALVVVLILIVALKPAPTEDNAEDYLITSADFDSIDTERRDDVTDFTESGIFSSSCDARDDLEDALGRGDDWGSDGFENTDSDQNSFWLTQQIIGFDSSEEIDDVMAAVEDGAGDSDCGYSSYTSTMTYVSSYDDAEKLSDLDLPGDGLLVRNDTKLTMTLTTTSDGSYVFARRGNVLTVFSVYSGDSSYKDDVVSYNDLEDVLKICQNRFNG
jgi:hypothetical protein